MNTELRRRIGFELELLAPKGSSRRALADELAARCGGSVHPMWHVDSEPAPVESLGGRFIHLTQGFEVRRPSGDVLCTLVDDITITADLDRSAPALPGWHRLLTDDLRFAWLLERHCDPAAPLATVLGPVAALWDAEVEQVGSVLRLDARGATIALAAPTGGERERPCEIVTPPIAEGHGDRLEELLAPARDLGFAVPREAAVHLHLDGKPFRDAATLANVVRLFGHWREPLRERLGTNPECRRLQPLPAGLVAVADGDPSYDELREAAARSGLSKFFDVNLTQLFRDNPMRDTLEIRILAGAIHSADVVGPAVIIERLLDRCEEGPRIERPADDDEMMSW